MLLLTIPKPCHEDWNQMTQVERGAFCSACSKIVVDFTTYTNAEIKDYFLNHKGQRTCGRFRGPVQEDSTGLLTTIISSGLPVWKKFLAAVVILFATLFISCKQNTTGQIAVEENTTLIPAAIDTPHVCSTNSIDMIDSMALPVQTTLKGTTGITVVDFVPPEIKGDMELLPPPAEEPLGAVIDIKNFEPAKKDSVKIIKNTCNGLNKDSVVILIP